jgi:hypothetical protein
VNNETDIAFDCPLCSGNLVVDVAGAGLTVDCPHCGQPITIPRPEPSPEPEPLALPQPSDVTPSPPPASSSVSKGSWGHCGITPRQVAVLLFFNVPFDPKLKRGGASGLIGGLFGDPTNRQLWDEAKKRKMSEFRGTPLHDYVVSQQRKGEEDVDAKTMEEALNSSVGEAKRKREFFKRRAMGEALREERDEWSHLAGQYVLVVCRNPRKHEIDINILFVEYVSDDFTKGVFLVAVKPKVVEGRHRRYIEWDNPYFELPVKNVLYHENVSEKFVGEGSYKIDDEVFLATELYDLTWCQQMLDKGREIAKQFLDG